MHLDRAGFDTVGCDWNFQIGGGCKSAIFQYIKLKFDLVKYFGLINSPTVAKIFSCKNGFLSLIFTKPTRDIALKTISLDSLANSTPIWYINKLNLQPPPIWNFQTHPTVYTAEKKEKPHYTSKWILSLSIISLYNVHRQLIVQSFIRHSLPTLSLPFHIYIYTDTARFFLPKETVSLECKYGSMWI